MPVLSTQPIQATTSTTGSDPVVQYSLVISGTATSTSSGTGAINTLMPAGGFADLGIANPACPDPAMSWIAGSEALTAVTSAWQRTSLTATAPIDYNRGEAGTLWNGAAYASVGLRWDSLPASSTMAFDRIQLAQAPFGNLLDRSAAVHDDHMCYESYNGTIATRTQERAMVGAYSAKSTILYIPSGSTGWGLDPHTDALAPLKAGSGRITARVSVSTDVSRKWRVWVRCYDANYNLVYDGLSSAADNTSRPNGIWSTAQVSVTAPSTARYACVTPFVYYGSGSPQIGWYFYADAHFIAYESADPAYQVPDWVAPRKLNIKVKPRRVNLVNNPGFNSGTSRWGFFGPSGVTNTFTWDSATGRTKTGSVKFQSPAGGTPGSQVGIAALGGINPGTKGGDLLHTGVPHTISAWVNVPAGYPPVSAAVWNPLAAAYQFGPNSDWIKANRPDLVDGNWVRVYNTWTPPATSTRQVYGGVMVPKATYQASTNGVLFWMDDVLLEESAELGDFFDGSDPSADYLWQGTNDASKSLYFPGRARHAQRLTEILQDNVPWGTTFNLDFS
ncbi:hypothetical protein [Streptomyces sp. NPDC057253]|uniref:hypothetical protein n=1 Tax=Streptomyces sp. NPDC057253 TaxID=3346069 RepID=UPI00362FAD6D